MVSLEKYEYDLAQPNTDARITGKNSKTSFAIVLTLQNMFDLKWGPMHATKTS